MSSTQNYIERAKLGAEAHAAMADLIARQWKEATDYNEARFASRNWPFVITVTCGCGRRHAIECMFRCFFCGVFFCEGCAREHFGEEGDHEPPKFACRETEKAPQ